MLKIRRPLGRLIFNMGIAIPGKTIFLIETAPRYQPNLITFYMNWSNIISQYHSSFKIIWYNTIHSCRMSFQLTMIITRDSEVIMFSPCVFVCLFVCGCLCLSRCLSGRFNYEGLVPHKQYFAGTLLGMSSCASYVSRTHDVIDDVSRSQSRSNFEIDISPSIF